MNAAAEAASASGTALAPRARRMARPPRTATPIRVKLVLLCALMAAFASACTASSNDGDANRADDAAADGAALDDAGSRDAGVGGSLRVLVAASLIPVAEALADEFEARHPGVDVMISGAGSSALREQVLAGAPADVFIPADPAHLDAVRAEVGLMGGPVAVARNSLVLAIPADNPAGVASLADLGRPELLVGLCAPEVPCGALARAGLARAGIEPQPDTDEPNVRALVTKLAAGELDAALVYASDAHTASTTEPADAPGSSAAITSLGWPSGTAPQAWYAAAVLADAPNSTAATRFVAFLLTEPARAVFLDHGFMAP